MKRALLSQMAHEWKNNIWLIIELAIVTLAIWAIMTLLWVLCKGLTQPLGFNPTDVYTLDVKSVPESSPYFLADYKDKYFEDRNKLIERLRNNPHVEAVSLHNNFAPFEYNYSGNFFEVEGWIPESIGYTGNVRRAEPEIVRILDIKSTTGKSQDQLIGMLQRGEVLISHNRGVEQKMGPIENIIGKKIYPYQEEEKGKRIGDVVDRVRRSDYEYEDRGVLIVPIDPVTEWGDIILKLKSGQIQDFINDFNSDPSLSHLRNIYLSNLKSLEKKGEALNKEIEINIRLMVAISFFLLVTIFLGLLGSFWFRVQQRVSEFAIRKTFGAKDSELFRRILGEGLLLLVASLLLVSACVWPFIKKLSDYTGEDWWVFIAFEGIVTGVMAIGIILSLSYPAWRAMKIEPAIAVKEE
ncbi:MAG: FtsX-like permease family protein [Muribaculaceae bacterium]|nr:FtsX-like permease family protein [Muribaculaceae bacterium]